MLGTLVALKALPFDERLLAEARRAAVCSDHPHVATIHNILRTEVGGINRYWRASRGVTVMKPQDGDRIVSITTFVDNRPLEELPEGE